LEEVRALHGSVSGKRVLARVVGGPGREFAGGEFFGEKGSLLHDATFEVAPANGRFGLVAPTADGPGGRKIDTDRIALTGLPQVLD